jgi:transposase
MRVLGVDVEEVWHAAVVVVELEEEVDVKQHAQKKKMTPKNHNNKFLFYKVF